MLRACYVGLFDLLSKKAHAHNVAKTCEYLNAAAGVSVVFVTAHCGSPQNKNELVFEMHGIKKPFPIVVLKSRWDTLNLSKFYLPIRLISANWAILKYLWQQRADYEIIYLRDHLLLLVIFIMKKFFNKKIFYEIHYIYNNWWNRFPTDWLAAFSDGVITITRALQNYYVRLNKNIITIFCSGIELADYENLTSDRRALNLPDNKILIGYAGNMIKTNLGDSYGLEEIVRSLKFLPEEFYFVGVGDKNNETAFLKAIAKKEGINESRVILLPWQARQYIPAFLNSFDILVVPCAGGRPGNSPTKMIEYLAAGRPIVACRAQAIMEILRDRENCLLAQNESGDWAQKTAQIYQDKELSKKIVSQALREAGQYTWEKRAQKIADFIKKIYEKNY